VAAETAPSVINWNEPAPIPPNGTPLAIRCEWMTQGVGGGAGFWSEPSEPDPFAPPESDRFAPPGSDCFALPELD